MKQRIDRILVDRGLADTREKAQALIMAGLVSVDGQPVRKAGAPTAPDATIRVQSGGSPYVSRGGTKLEGALNAFDVQVDGRVCVDIGCSTGGFTHCLLMRGASRVFAVDVDVKQLDWKIRQDPRVIPIECNARFLEPAAIAVAADLIVIDASFISLRMLLPRVPGIMKSGATCIALVKPQFEVGRERVGKGGIVRDYSDQMAAVERILQAGEAEGLLQRGQVESPITGREGNREFFVRFEKP